jgi:integrase
MKTAQKSPPGIEKKGNLFRVRLMRGEVQVRQSFPTLASAVEFRDRTLLALRGQTYQDNREERSTTLRELIQRYLDEVTVLKASPKQERNRLMLWQREEFAGLPISSIRSSHITAWRNRRVAEGRAPSTVANGMNSLSKVFRVAKSEWSLNVENPVRGIARPPKRHHREASPDDRLEALLVAKAAESRAAWLGYLITVAAWTAMRQGELTALRWSDINFDETFIRVRAIDAGGRKSPPRYVPMLDRVRGALLEWLGNKPANNSAFVFPAISDTEKRLAQDSATTAFRRLMADVVADELKEGRVVRPITFHDLRHFGCTRLAPLHDGPLDLSKTTGHKSLAMLSIYFNPSPSERAKIIRARDAALRAIAA